MEQDNEKPFPFLALPPELREQIYTHLLVRHRILVSYNQTLPAKSRQGSSSVSMKRKKLLPKGLIAISEIPSSKSDRRTTTFELPTSYANPTTLSILLTNRQISLEASYTLYTHNTFDFRTMPAVRLFVDAIGPRNRAFLTRVMLSSWNRLGWTIALKALGTMTEVREVGIAVWKFDTYECRWEGFLREVVEGFVVAGEDGDVEERMGKVRFFAGGGEIWERRDGNVVMGSGDVEGEGVRELKRAVRGL